MKRLLYIILFLFASAVAFGQIEISTDGGRVMVADSTAANAGHYTTFKALDDTADAHITKIELKSDISWNEGLTVNETYEGHTASITAGENVVFGQVLVLKSDGEYYLTDADAVTTMPGQVIALESKGNGQACLVLIEGYICDTDWNWTLGDGQANTLYPDDATPGAMVQHAAAPSDVGDQVQTVGRVITADTIFFRPSWDLTEVGS